MLNAMTGAVIRQIQVPSLITQMAFSNSLLLSGAGDGYLRTHDPRTGVTRNGGSESSVKAHYSSVQGLETIGNFVFTIGLSLRSLQTYCHHRRQDLMLKIIGSHILSLILWSKCTISGLCVLFLPFHSPLVQLSFPLFRNGLQASLSPPTKG